jgi:hypothetical protein
MKAGLIAAALAAILAGCATEAIDSVRSDLMPRSVALTIVAKNLGSAFANSPTLIPGETEGVFCPKGAPVSIGFEDIEYANYARQGGQLRFWIENRSKPGGSCSWGRLWDLPSEQAVAETVNALQSLGARLSGVRHIY